MSKLKVRLLARLLLLVSVANGLPWSLTYPQREQADAPRRHRSFVDVPTFTPIEGMKVSSGCQWDIRTTKMTNRIPETITEIACRNPQSSCTANPFFRCRQLTTRMDVAYTSFEPWENKTRSYEQDEIVRYRRSIEVGIGCACVLHQPKRIEQFLQMVVEKRG